MSLGDNMSLSGSPTRNLIYWNWATSVTEKPPTTEVVCEDSASDFAALKMFADRGDMKALHKIADIYEKDQNWPQALVYLQKTLTKIQERIDSVSQKIMRNQAIR